MIQRYNPNYAEHNDADAPLMVPDEDGAYVCYSTLAELKRFVQGITLDLQKHREKTPKQLDAMFQKAYKLYVKYNVEGKDGR